VTDHTEGVAANKRLWDGWADLHVAFEFYAVDSFVANPAARPLDSIARDLVGDVSGKRLLHLQCHFGMDTLRFALMGASATGVDFSAVAIGHARELSRRTGIDAVFVESDVRALPAEVAVGGYDVVFASYGVISWLPELRQWAESIASRLASGGVFCIAEMHPSLWIFDEEQAEPRLDVRYPYFNDGTPLHFVEKGSYGAPDSDFEADSYSWQHSFEDILGALTGAGLTFEMLREYPKTTWRQFPFLEQDAEGYWRLPASLPEIPMLFALRMRKP
jgi:SAM-dependent methyltransferase